MNSAKLLRACGEIFSTSLHQRASTYQISGRMMMQRDCSLNEPLQKSFFYTIRFAPYVFPDFMSVIELARIEEANPEVIAVGVHC